MQPILLLAPSLPLCDIAPCETPTGRRKHRTTRVAWLRSATRTLASLLRYAPTLSDQTIGETTSSDLLRRH